MKRFCVPEALERRVMLAGDVVISEFMAANQDTLRDSARQYPDWIELWNRSDKVVALDEFYLTDDSDDLSKWAFPDGVTIEPQQFMVVFATGADTIDEDGAIHTNFELNAGGEYLALVRANTLEICSEFGAAGENFPQQFGDVSYGDQGAPSGLVASDVPVAISSSSPSTVVSTIGVNGLLGTVTDVNVFVTIMHSFASDLAVNLISPTGTRVELVSGLGGDGDHFIETIFDDDSPFAIGGFGGPPFTGLFQPVGSLSDLNGEEPNGVWSIEVHDNNSAEGGSLEGWSMTMSTTEGGELTSEGLVGHLPQPTPGAPNSVEVVNTGPLIHEVTDRVGSWSPDQDLVVTAKLGAHYDAVRDVRLLWRIDYLEEQTSPMRDDGLGVDEAAGDGIYSAVIAHSNFAAGQMVRWAVAANDVMDRTSRNPAFLDSEGTSQSAEYYGTVIDNPEIESSLDVFQWFLEPGQERRADSTRGTRTSVYYLDQFYDNAFVRLRGGSSTNLPKKSYKFDFNTSDRFRFHEDTGRVSEININTTFTNKDYVRQALAFETYDKAGVMGSEAFPIRVDRNGEFFSVAILVEQPDAAMLAREGRDPDGALYKMFNTFATANGVEKKTRRHENNTDLADFVRDVADLSGDALRNYLFDNVNIPSVLNYLAVSSIIQNNDQMAKNYLLFRDTNGTQEWEFIPWDLDLTFGLHFMSNDNIRDDVIWADKDAFTTFAGVTIWPSHPFVGNEAHPGNRSWNRLIEALYQVPEIREMYLRRLRTLMDDLLQPPGTSPADLKFEARLDEYFALIESDAKLDYAKWANPWWGENETLTQSMQRIKDEFLEIRRHHLYVTHGIDNIANGEDLAGIPHAQAPDVSVVLGDNVEHSPTSGDALERYFTIENPNDFAVDLSGWTVMGSVEHVLGQGTTIVAGGRLYLSPDVRAFRSRPSGPSGDQGNLVQGIRQAIPSSGTLTLSDPIGRVVSTVNYSSEQNRSPQQDLRISEIHFNPYQALPNYGEPDVDSSNFEFIEIVNTGLQSVDLTGVRLIEVRVDNEVQGITFEFGSGMLDPGQRTLVVKSEIAFAARYGGLLPVAGEFIGKLSNGGERLTLLDSRNDVILQVDYDDRGNWPGGLTDGEGASLELVDVQLDATLPMHWRASQQFGGSPGSGPVMEATGIVINELLSASTAPQVDQVELFNTSTQTIDISGWYLSDTQNVFRYQIPAQTPPIGPGEFMVLDETTFGFGFRGNDNDDARLVVSDATGRPVRFADYVTFPPSTPGVSFGRWPNGSGPFQSMPTRSLGALNPMPIALPGDLNGDLLLSADDVDYFCRQLHSNDPIEAADVDGDGQVDALDLSVLLEQLGTVAGDSNFDGRFDSSDLVAIFQAGQYEDARSDNSNWKSGDWNCDSEFTTADLVWAFQTSVYLT